MIKAVVFDLDDTLYDEIDYCRSGFNAVAAHLAESNPEHSPDDIFIALWDEFTAGNRTRTFNTALETLSIPADGTLTARLIDVYRRHEPDIELPEQSRRVIELLNGKYALAMLTDGFLPAQQLKVRALGIEHYFDCILYTEQLGREFWKPCPAGYEKIARTLDIAPDSMVYIGDNEKKDFIAANKLGFLTVQLIRQARMHTETSPDPLAPAKYRINSLDELAPLLDTFQ